MLTKSVLILDPQLLFAQALSAIYEREKKFEVVGFTNEISEALQLAASLKPGIVIAGMHVPVSDGLNLTRELFSVSVRSGLIVMGWPAYHDFAAQFLWAGARGYISKSSPAEELLQATKIVHEGGLFVTDEVRNKSSLSRSDLYSLLILLSPKEIEIIRLTQKGYSKLQIANSIGVSVKVIEMQQYKILQKLGLRSSEAIHHLFNRKVFPH
jgi:DNA-binding NarL/FixJ family response regulator